MKGLTLQSGSEREQVSKLVQMFFRLVPLLFMVNCGAIVRFNTTNTTVTTPITTPTDQSNATNATNTTTTVQIDTTPVASDDPINTAPVSSGGLSGNAILGIVLGSIVGGVLLILCCCQVCCCALTPNASCVGLWDVFAG